MDHLFLVLLNRNNSSFGAKTDAINKKPCLIKNDSFF